MVRPLLIANFPRVVGGGELGLVELALELDRRGLQPIVAVPCRAGEKPFADHAAAASLDLRPIPDAIPDAAKKLRWHAAECEVVHATGARGLAAAALARTGRPLVWHVRVAAHDKLDPILMRLPDFIIANSRATAARFGGRARVRVIFNGIRAPRAPGTPLPLEPGRKRIGVIGRMTPEKGHLDLLPVLEEILARRSDVDVVFAGEGSGAIGDAVRARAASDARMKMLGVVPDMADHIAELDLVVVPSLVEGFGRVAAEALRAGVNVLARRVGGLVEVLAPLNDPWLPGDRRDWADRISRELDIPSHSADELKRFGARFDPSRHADEVVKAYEEVVSTKVS